MGLATFFASEIVVACANVAVNIREILKLFEYGYLLILVKVPYDSDVSETDLDRISLCLPEILVLVFPSIVHDK